MINAREIKARLRAQGNTQKSLAEYVGIAQPTMNQKINGTRPMYVEEAEMVAKYLGITSEDFCKIFFAT